MPLTKPFRLIYFRLFHLLVLCSIAFSASVEAQQEFSTQQEMEKALSKAKKYMLAKTGDKALPITETLMKQLKTEQEYDSPLGFRVRLIHGLALINSSADVSAFDFLWSLKDESKAYQEWSVFADACREIARIQEFSGQSDEARNNLIEAQNVIKKYQIDSIYSSFAVRYSSWHRNYGDIDSARFYAEEVLRFAPRFKQTFEEAEGNLLLGLINFKENKEQAFSHFKRGAFLYHKIGEYATFNSMQSSMSRVLLHQGQLQTAMIHVDSAIQIGIQYLNSDPYRMNRPYKIKSSIYQAMGQLDSSIAYLQKAHDIELKSIEQTRKDLLVSIDKKYNVEKKEKELKVEQQKSRLFIIIILLIGILVLIILFYFRKLQKVNRLNQQQAEALKNLDKLKSRFFANVSHELRTPLSLIIGPIKTLLKENKLSNKQINLLQIAKKGSSNLENLVHEILDLSKMEAGKMELHLETTPLATFFEYYLTQFDSLADFKEVNYQYLISISKDYTAMIDREKTRQILFNLLSNAFKFTPPHGKINVTVQLKKDNLYFQIIDTGKGIHPNDLPNIFERYFQTTQKNAAATGGTGIGLAICNEYTKLFGGTINVSSQLNAGTTFEVIFPISEISNETIDNSSNHFDKEFETPQTDTILPIHPSQKKNSKAPTLLLVEDNPNLQNYMRLVLESEYKIVVAGNGEKAWEILEENKQPIDLIISDLMMPVMDGYQLLDKLKSTTTTHQIPTIMLTARVGKDDRLKALRIGVDSYLTKPFDEEELKIQIKNLLNNQVVRQRTLQEEAIQKEKIISNTQKAPNQISTSDTSAIIDEQMQNLENLVRQNISNPSLSVSMLIDEMAMSESTLLRLLKKNTGLSTKKYITEIRLIQAREMLENGQYDSITRAGLEVGYTDVRTFSRSFKNRFGRLPSKLIKQNASIK